MRRFALACSLAAIASLSACQTKTPPPSTGGGKSAALRAMEQVAIVAHKCWFASKDPAFKAYAFANELNSMSGSPRFLLVPAKNFGGKPLLVVQAQGSGNVTAFGPLLSEPIGARISADLTRWKTGDTSCGASA